jgi:hypothetical protein
MKNLAMTLDRRVGPHAAHRQLEPMATMPDQHNLVIHVG